MNRILLTFITCVFAICVLANGQEPISTKPALPQKSGQVVLRKRIDNKLPRIPSNNLSFQIAGEYTETGLLHLYPAFDSEWRLDISSMDGYNTYYASTSELQDGIHIGALAEFAITLTSESGEIFIGEFYGE